MENSLLKFKIFLVLFPMLFLCSCIDTVDNPVAPSPKVIEISVDEASKDANNLKQIHIADVSLSNSSEIVLVVIKEHPSIDRLKSVIEEIKLKDGLELSYETMEGTTRYYMVAVVYPGNSTYIHALREELANQGFRAEVR